ncbi:hypothetical protein Q9S71_06100 [Microbacterium sp. KSW4-11]|uniref:IclR-ED domain-containing protein n=1 Tax=Microbacterium gawkjiense TaxID=3067309 RepID=A0ABU3G9B1_9MICO|nr:hypothetical protein [Microbacterium sp. KSW4-11]MDT3316391.1 hypothetical protein [Microbacterium sp. KSW4-11]
MTFMEGFPDAPGRLEHLYCSLLFTARATCGMTSVAASHPLVHVDAELVGVVAVSTLDRPQLAPKPVLASVITRFLPTREQL